VIDATDTATLRAEIERCRLQDPVKAQRLTQVVTLLEVASELRRRAQALLDGEEVTRFDRTETEAR
jgi:hypothetical protein